MVHVYMHAHTTAKHVCIHRRTCAEWANVCVLNNMTTQNILNGQHVRATSAGGQSRWEPRSKQASAQASVIAVVIV